MNPIVSSTQFAILQPVVRPAKALRNGYHAVEPAKTPRVRISVPPQAADFLGTSPVARGFTLFELLVVVTVIMVLISILMPVIASVRNQSKLVVCASNLRQWGVVIQSYAQDNRGKIPETAPTYYDLNPGNRTYWAVLKVQQAANPAWISFSALQPYFNDDPDAATSGLPRFWNCSATPGGNQGTAYQYVYWTSYVYMGRVSSWASLASDPSQFQDRRLEAQRILMADRLLWTNQAWYLNHPRFDYIQDWDPKWTPVLRLNQLFGDGRVSTRKGSDLPISAMTGGAPVGLYALDGGWFGNKAYF